MTLQSSCFSRLPVFSDFQWLLHCIRSLFDYSPHSGVPCLSWLPPPPPPTTTTTTTTTTIYIYCPRSPLTVGQPWRHCRCYVLVVDQQAVVVELVDRRCLPSNGIHIYEYAAAAAVSKKQAASGTGKESGQQRQSGTAATSSKRRAADSGGQPQQQTKTTQRQRRGQQNARATSTQNHSNQKQRQKATAIASSKQQRPSVGLGKSETQILKQDSDQQFKHNIETSNLKTRFRPAI